MQNYKLRGPSNTADWRNPLRRRRSVLDRCATAGGGGEGRGRGGGEGREREEEEEEKKKKNCRGMRHTQGIREMQTGFWSGNPKEKRLFDRSRSINKNNIKINHK